MQEIDLLRTKAWYSTKKKKFYYALKFDETNGMVC